MQAKERLYRTGNGRLVREGDEDGLTLAYTPGDDVLPRDESLVPGDEPAEQDAGEVKAADAPGNKQAPRPGDKGQQLRR